TRITDMSWHGAAATTCALRFWPSTTTCTWSAPLMTWLLETMRLLSRSSTQPVPPATTPSPVWLMSTSTVAGLTAATISDELGALEPPGENDDHDDDHGDQRDGARDARDDHRPVDRAAEHDALDARRRGRSAPGSGCS